MTDRTDALSLHKIDIAADGYCHRCRRKPCYEQTICDLQAEQGKCAYCGFACSGVGVALCPEYERDRLREREARLVEALEPFTTYKEVSGLHMAKARELLAELQEREGKSTQSSNKKG